MTEKQKAVLQWLAELKFPLSGSKSLRGMNTLRRNVFMSGAAAMDGLDKWISVDTELPKAIEGFRMSKDVLVLFEDEYYVEYYMPELNRWSCKFNPSHWQPIQPPKK